MVKIELGDIVELKKSHPCGSRQWEILRLGSDIRIRCLGCGRQIMIQRSKLEKRMKKIFKGESTSLKNL